MTFQTEIIGVPYHNELILSIIIQFNIRSLSFQFLLKLFGPFVLCYGRHLQNTTHFFPVMCRFFAQIFSLKVCRPSAPVLCEAWTWLHIMDHSINQAVFTLQRRLKEHPDWVTCGWLHLCINGNCWGPKVRFYWPKFPEENFLRYDFYLFIFLHFKITLLCSAQTSAVHSTKPFFHSAGRKLDLNVNSVLAVGALVCVSAVTANWGEERKEGV